MKFVPMKTLMAHALKHHYAVPSFCAWNAEIMETILQVCQRLKAPVILMAGGGEFELLSTRIAPSAWNCAAPAPRAFNPWTFSKDSP